MYIKRDILNVRKDNNLKIVINSGNNVIGQQREVDKHTDYSSNDLINPVNDMETLKFKINPESFINFNFNGITSFIGAGFTQNEIDSQSLNILNSFFILDFYDTFDTNTQIKLFKSYLTKIGNEPIYEINNTNQLYYLYIPKSYINSITGNTIIGYVNFTFYNAKTGNLSIFYNLTNQLLTTPEKYHFKCELNFINRTWKFIDSPLNAIEKVYTNTYNYNTKINNTVETQDLIEQTFPTGNTHNYIDNTYVTV